MNKGRFTTSRINASRVRVGTVLYHGGQVTAVGRTADGKVTLMTQWGPMTFAPTYRLTYYPRLGG